MPCRVAPAGWSRRSTGVTPLPNSAERRPYCRSLQRLEPAPLASRFVGEVARVGSVFQQEETVASSTVVRPGARVAAWRRSVCRALLARSRMNSEGSLEPATHHGRSSQRFVHAGAAQITGGIAMGTSGQRCLWASTVSPTVAQPGAQTAATCAHEQLARSGEADAANARCGDIATHIARNTMSSSWRRADGIVGVQCG